MKLSFIEQKHPDVARITELFQHCKEKNYWANRGPLYRLLQERFEAHMKCPRGTAVIPVSNGGMALEAMARFHAAQVGRPLRWVGSAYSFQNLGRGYFSDMTFVDCDAGGRLDLAVLEGLDPDCYDGIIAVNPFGVYTDFSAYTDFAQRTGKVFLLDNAAGVSPDIPNVAWQAFSLHHTKPYGVGEGGLALVPAEHANDVYSLLDYETKIAPNLREHWLQNGKLSDVSCAFLLDRLERWPDWSRRSLEQRNRIIAIVAKFGLQPLYTPTTDIPLTSLPFLSEHTISHSAIDASRHITLAKYYRPLANLPQVNSLVRRLVNIPCHGDVASLSTGVLETDITDLLRAPAGGYRSHFRVVSTRG